MHTQVRWTFSNKIRTNLFPFVWVALLWIFTLAQALGQQQYHAQSAVSAASASTAAVVRKITITGTAEQMQNIRDGVHILVNSAQGPVDAHLGPSISAEIQVALAAGEPVQITGSFQTLNGQQYLLAHEIATAGHTFTLRNDNGFPVHARSATQSAVAGGAQ